MPRPTESSVLELLKFCLHRSEALFQLRVVVWIFFPRLDQLLRSLDEVLHFVTSLDEVHTERTGQEGKGTSERQNQLGSFTALSSSAVLRRAVLI